jgi:hypothetical protein
MKDLLPDIWLPHFWFFLYTVAHSFPDHPNAVIKRKYYDFVQNLPLYCPHGDLRNRFTRLLDTFPVTPYLDNKDSFTYWVHFVNNKMDYEIGKEEHTYFEHLDSYYESYLPKSYSLSKQFKIERKYIIMMILVLCGFFILLYTK